MWPFSFLKMSHICRRVDGTTPTLTPTHRRRILDAYGPNGHFIHAGPLEGTRVSIYLSAYGPSSVFKVGLDLKNQST